MTHAIEILPENVQEVKAKMNEMGINEDGFSADVFFHYYQARDWKIRGEAIMHWSSLLVCWDRNGRKKNGNRHSSTNNTSVNTSTPHQAIVGSESLPIQGLGETTREDEVSIWLDCQYPMPEEPEKHEAAERLERVYSLEHQPQFGKYEHLKEILTSNNITIEAAVRTISPAVTERIIIRHLDDLAAHFHTPLLTYSLLEMQQTARLIINKAPHLKFSELMLICQRAKEENLLPQSRVCRGDIMELIHNYPEWKRNTLEFL